MLWLLSWSWVKIYTRYFSCNTECFYSDGVSCEICFHRKNKYFSTFGREYRRFCLESEMLYGFFDLESERNFNYRYRKDSTADLNREIPEAISVSEVVSDACRIDDVITDRDCWDCFLYFRLSNGPEGVRLRLNARKRARNILSRISCREEHPLICLSLCRARSYISQSLKYSDQWEYRRLTSETCLLQPYVTPLGLPHSQRKKRANVRGREAEERKERHDESGMGILAKKRQSTILAKFKKTRAVCLSVSFRCTGCTKIQVFIKLRHCTRYFKRFSDLSSNLRI